MAEEIIPDLMDELEDNEEDWEECPEEEMAEQNLSQCLFCSDMYPNPEEAFRHCKKDHNFDIIIMTKLHNLDCFGFIKIINYIRLKSPEIESLKQQYTAGLAPWDDEAFMKPVLLEDGLIQFDIEDCDPSFLGVSDVPDTNGESSGCTGEDIVTMSKQEYNTMITNMKQLEVKASRAEQELQCALEDLAKIRSAAHDLMMSQPMVPVSSDNVIQTLTEEEDDEYFGSYGHFSIHEEMLKDKVRTETYRDSMMKNTEFFKDKIVLDVGCGTGILSMFAAQAGAKLVIGVDQSDVIYQAIDIVRENGLEDKVKLLKGRMEDVNLPVEKVDVIISEWMGYFLLFESMLDTVIWARDHYLKPGGVVLPNYCNICVLGLADPTMHDSHIKFWENVYGFRMNCMKSAVYKEASVLVVNKDKILTDPCCIKELDTCTCTIKDLDFTGNFKITAKSSGTLTALVAYFEIGFNNLPTKVAFSTGPFDTSTHWKQSVFLLEKPIELNEGECLEGHLKCQKNRKDPRALTINITMNDKTLLYYMQ